MHVHIVFNIYDIESLSFSQVLWFRLLIGLQSTSGSLQNYLQIDSEWITCFRDKPCSLFPTAPCGYPHPSHHQIIAGETGQRNHESTLREGWIWNCTRRFLPVSSAHLHEQLSVMGAVQASKSDLSENSRSVTYLL